MHEIERELIEITEHKVRKFDDRQDYLKSIFTAVQKLSNEDFDALTDEAATWANACVEAYNTDKNGDLPDFDEIESDDQDDDTDNEVDDDTDNDSDEGDDDQDDSKVDEDSLPDDIDDEPEEVKPEPKKVKKAAKPKVEKVKPTKPVKKPASSDDEEIIELDKWGCLTTSKNSQALAMFEKGATTTDVKNAIGGTYYNILNKMVSHGHKLEKKGSMFKLTHVTEKGSLKPKKKS
jgi:hypothetical protein